MAKVELTSYAFNGGELDPGMQERVDYQKYATGAAKIINMIPRPTGGAFRRPGLRFVAEAANSDLPVRLIPFRYSAEQSYVIEASEFLARFIKDDGLVAYPTGHANAGQVVEVVSPYAALDLAKLNFTQSANTIFFAHADYAPRLLTRGTDHHLWTFSQFNLGTRPASPNLSLTTSGNDGAKYVVTAVTGAGESGNSNSVTATKSGTISYTGGTSFAARRNWLIGRDAKGEGNGQPPCLCVDKQWVKPLVNADPDRVDEFRPAGIAENDCLPANIPQLERNFHAVLGRFSDKQAIGRIGVGASPTIGGGGSKRSLGKNPFGESPLEVAEHAVAGIVEFGGGRLGLRQRIVQRTDGPKSQTIQRHIDDVDFASHWSPL